MKNVFYVNIDSSSKTEKAVSGSSHEAHFEVDDEAFASFTVNSKVASLIFFEKPYLAGVASEDALKLKRWNSLPRSEFRAGLEHMLPPCYERAVEVLLQFATLVVMAVVMGEGKGAGTRGWTPRL